MKNRLPQGLFGQIIKRLGLEKQLRLIKKHLWVFTGFFLFFVLLLVFAFIGLKEVISESNFGSFISLIFSDPVIITKYWQSFLLSLFESIPSLAIVMFLIPIALVLLFAKFVGADFERCLLLIKSTRKSKNHGLK